MSGPCYYTKHIIKIGHLIFMFVTLKDELTKHFLDDIADVKM